MIPVLVRAYPAPLEPTGTWAGAEWLDDPASYENYQRFGGGDLDRAAWAALDQRFLTLYRDALSARRGLDDAELLEIAAALTLNHTTHHDRRPPLAGALLDGDILCDIVEDLVPDIVPEAGDRILGPWADDAPPRALLAAAAEALMSVPLLVPDTLVTSRWLRENRGAGAARGAAGPGRRGFNPWLRAPAMLWRLGAGGGLTPLLPLSPRLAPPPDAPIRGRIAWLSGAPGDALVARAWPIDADPEGAWQLLGAIGLPAAPPLPALIRRLTLELWRTRRHERRATWEDLLRRRPEVLYRTCSRWCWMRETR